MTKAESVAWDEKFIVLFEKEHEKRLNECLRATAGWNCSTCGAKAGAACKFTSEHGAGFLPVGWAHWERRNEVTREAAKKPSDDISDILG